jgi:hypothetical protein
MEAGGIEPPSQPSKTAENTAVFQSGGAKSGAVGHETRHFPPDLAEVVNAWALLPEALRAGILAMVKGANP